MKRRSGSSRPASSPPANAESASANAWRPNPYAKRISAGGWRRLVIEALAAELGPELAILAPDLAEAFPTSDAVNEALRTVLAAARTVRNAKPATKRRRRAA